MVKKCGSAKAISSQPALASSSPHAGSINAQDAAHLSLKAHASRTSKMSNLSGGKAKPSCSLSTPTFAGSQSIFSPTGGNTVSQSVNEVNTVSDANSQYDCFSSQNGGLRRKTRGRAPWAGWGKLVPNTKQRRKLLKKCGKKCFLGSNLSFPVCAKNSCKVNKKGVYAAYVRSRQLTKRKSKSKARSPSFYNRISRKAKNLLRKMGLSRKKGGAKSPQKHKFKVPFSIRSDIRSGTSSALKKQQKLFEESGQHLSVKPRRGLSAEEALKQKGVILDSKRYPDLYGTKCSGSEKDDVANIRMRLEYLMNISLRYNSAVQQRDLVNATKYLNQYILFSKNYLHLPISENIIKAQRALARLSKRKKGALKS